MHVGDSEGQRKKQGPSQSSLLHPGKSLLALLIKKLRWLFRFQIKENFLKHICTKEKDGSGNSSSCLSAYPFQGPFDRIVATMLHPRKEAGRGRTGTAGAGSRKMSWLARVQFGDEPRKRGSTRAGDTREMTNAIIVFVEGCKEDISGH